MSSFSGQIRPCPRPLNDRFSDGNYVGGPLKKVLVTGAGGFIGSHLVEGLVRAGADVRALVYYNAQGSWGWLEELPEDVRRGIEVFLGDIRDPHRLAELVDGCDTVFHLAALIGIPFSYESPGLYVDTNVKGTLNLLQGARDRGVERFVHTSTSEVYGTARVVPISEDHQLQPQSPYAASKVGADSLALSFQAAFGLPVSVVRPFNTYGPRQSARAVIPTIIMQIASGARSVVLGSLHPTRDFSFVSDTVSGLILAGQREESVGKVVNLGSGFEISVGDTARLIAEVMDAEVEISTDPARMRPAASEVDRLYADTARARDLLGWEPEFGDVDGFRKGLARTADWFSQPGILERYKVHRYMV